VTILVGSLSSARSVISTEHPRVGSGLTAIVRATGRPSAVVEMWTYCHFGLQSEAHISAFAARGADGGR
jgi:hypothetical protein